MGAPGVHSSEMSGPFSQSQLGNYLFFSSFSSSLHDLPTSVLLGQPRGFNVIVQITTVKLTTVQITTVQIITVWYLQRIFWFHKLEYDFFSML